MSCKRIEFNPGPCWLGVNERTAAGNGSETPLHRGTASLTVENFQATLNGSSKTNDFERPDSIEEIIF